MLQLSTKFHISPLRNLFASVLKGKGLKPKESELALLLGFQGVSDLKSEEEPAEVKIIQISECAQDKKIGKKEIFTTKNGESFTNHIENDNDERKDPTIIVASHPCETCGKIFNNKLGVEAHSKAHLTKKEKKSGKNIERALCNVCSKSFSNKYILKTHMIGHTAKERPSENFLCNICSKSFGNKYALKNHIDKHNGEGKEIEKALCNLCSTWTKYLSGHMKNMHGENKHVLCSNCGSNFRISSIKKHQKLCKFTEEEREARKAAKAKKCDKCGRVLCNIFKLRKHMEICGK